MRGKRQEAQNAVEYILLFAAVVVVLLAFLKPNGFFQKSVENIVCGTVTQVRDMVNDLNITAR